MKPPLYHLPQPHRPRRLPGEYCRASLGRKTSRLHHKKILIVTSSEPNPSHWGHRHLRKYLWLCFHCSTHLGNTPVRIHRFSNAGVCLVTPRLSALDLDLTNVPVSAILPPRSTLSLRLPFLPFPHPVPVPISTPDTPPPRPRAPELRRLNGSTGEFSLCGKYDTTGDPYDDDNDGGGTLGYVNACTPDTAFGCPTPPNCADDDDGGVVMCVPLLNTLPPAGRCADKTGENGNGEGDSIDEGECDNGVVASEVLFNGRWITPCDGIGTACVIADRTAGYPTDVLGDDTPDIDRRCVGCENGSEGVNPTKLSTDNPSCPCMSNLNTRRKHLQRTLRLNSNNSSR